MKYKNRKETFENPLQYMLVGICIIVVMLIVMGRYTVAELSAADDITYSREQIGSEGYEVYKRTGGELTGDGQITVRDALMVLKISLKLEPDADEQMEANADVNCDGIVDDADVYDTLRAAVLGTCLNMGYDRPENENYIIVDPDCLPIDDYCFNSLASVVEYLNENPPTDESERKIVLLVPGVHRGRVTLTAPYVTFRALDIEQETKVTCYYGTGYGYTSNTGGTTNTAASVVIEVGADDFHAEYITFENSYNIYVTEEELTDQIVTSAQEETVAAHREDPTTNQVQAQALYSRADRIVFTNCKFYGRQDTLYLDKGRVYLKDCYIEGTVDFIYGNATAVFDNCQINSPYGSGYLTAASTFATTDYGFLFYNCSLTREPIEGVSAPADASYCLGRPWGGDDGGDVAMVAFVNCKMDSHIRTGDDRFTDMSIKKEEARYSEYGTMDINGDLLALSEICASYETIWTEEDVTGSGTYAPWRWLYGDDGWNPGGYEVSDEL